MPAAQHAAVRGGRILMDKLVQQAFPSQRDRDHYNNRFIAHMGIDSEETDPEM